MKPASWLVFAPPGVAAADARERLRLVRDGFSLLAFIFGPLYFLSRRLWLAALFATLLIGAAIGARILLGLQPPFGALVALLPSLLLGLEAAGFEQRKLVRAGWTEVALVRASNATEAEIRAIERLSGDVAANPPPARPPDAAAAARQASPTFPATTVLGVFPEAVGRP